ncbi:uncharacterized protein A4U43_C07F6750 [Asparagus officinalis]|uniref:PRC-barrel domain-containing protein n=1 Tax=Asparagus officinalis TaxID=4686 RepID=A0A5P1EF37_ASPOF|nr:uncharacterized protein LOC109849465 isoform X2 [Asparagus officinalis]ONK62670.1 uncharacterized protein A4U43_C07F6750 [Asparagus officinalis]
MEFYEPSQTLGVLPITPQFIPFFFIASNSTDSHRRRHPLLPLRFISSAAISMCDCATLPSLSFKFRSQFQPQPSKFPQNPHQRFNLSINKTPQRNPRSACSENNNDSPIDDPSRDDKEQQRSSTFDFLELKRELEKEDELLPVEGLGNGGDGGLRSRRGGRRQMMRRSSLLAKQVISVETARSLGFVSQLWVDTSSWIVVSVEVRPNLLSGDADKFLLDDVCQVGDVVLVQDESVMENELKMIGLDTLVGYDVVTSGRRNVGKVRGYTFNINSGAVESLELDSFGVSIIPSSLVSTYCLFVEDVLEVASDTVTVEEGAASRVRRVTKGIWDAQHIDRAGGYDDEYYDFGRRGARSFQGQSRQNSRGRKFGRKRRVVDDDWELPMDY